MYALSTVKALQMALVYLKYACTHCMYIMAPLRKHSVILTTLVACHIHIPHTLLDTTQTASAEVWRQKETERANHLESALEEATATVVQLKSQLTNSSGSLDTAVAPLRKQKLELELTLTEAQRKVQVLELEVQRIEVKHKADLSALQIEVASKVRTAVLCLIQSSDQSVLHLVADVESIT
jgi:hypothetical protein